MSAFMVSDGTMDRVVSAILKLREDYGRGHFHTFSTWESTSGDRIGRALYEMNARAVAARYGEDDSPLPDYRWQPCAYKWPFEWYKAIQCLLYQCSEGDVPEEMLFQCLEKLGRELADQLLSEASEYKRAPWDCDRRDPRYQASA